MKMNLHGMVFKRPVRLGEVERSRPMPEPKRIKNAAHREGSTFDTEAMREFVRALLEKP